MTTFRPISISLSPNTERNDIYLALKLIFSALGKPASGGKPWKNGSAIKKLEENFKQYFKVKYTISFNSGRSALLAILESLNLKPGDEVLLQAFTCNAVSNPILWSRLSRSQENFDKQAELKPVYVDCNKETFNIDIKDLKRKITSRSRVIIVQHTFGLPVDIKEILEICKKNNLILIEDCAHSLGAEYKNKKVGTFGKAAFFSFSRDKVISSVYGGIAITNDNNLAEKIKDFQKKAGFPSNLWIFQQLLHPILLNFFILPTYSLLRLGKTSLKLFQWLHILSKAVHWKEKRSQKPNYFPKALPNALAVLAHFQLQKLEKFNNHRKKLANFYFSNLKNTSFELPKVFPDRKHIFLRFPIRHPKAHQIIKKAWRKNILIGDWYDIPIAPKDTRLDKMQYQPGSCEKAEKLAETTFNLPTHINISQSDAQKVIDFLKTYES
ncbi:aminotransferase class I/II-fold pyridoxal phosphate-dependent enzyme [Patescibacteria group bacterium]|nr:aminotransferase class I/II-fold pyridoxal phosphate-dependent enzyme [Patescibacteria group bacterium]